MSAFGFSKHFSICFVGFVRWDLDRRMWFFFLERASLLHHSLRWIGCPSHSQRGVIAPKAPSRSIFSTRARRRRNFRKWTKFDFPGTRQSRMEKMKRRTIILRVLVLLYRGGSPRGGPPARRERDALPRRSQEEMLTAALRPDDGRPCSPTAQESRFSWSNVLNFRFSHEFWVTKLCF